MKKKKILISALLALMSIGMAQAQAVVTPKAYVSVQQNSTTVSAVGTAAFDVSSEDVTMEFDAAGNAVMTINGVTVAKLTDIEVEDGGELVGALSGTEGITAEVTTAGYATYYSPFRLSVPESDDVSVYAPTYDSQNHVLKFTDATKVNGKVIPAGTGLLLKNECSEAKSITLTASASTEDVASSVGALNGEAVEISKPRVSGSSVYTLGYKNGEEQSAATFGFYKYTGTTLKPAKAYLLIPTIANVKYVGFDFGDDATGIGQIENGELKIANTVKCIEGGRIVIYKNGKKYNANGQEVN